MSIDEGKVKIGLGLRIAGIVMVLFMAFVAYWGIYGLQPPKTVPADAPLDVFSSGRAMEHLKVIHHLDPPPRTPGTYNESLGR